MNNRLEDLKNGMMQKAFLMLIIISLISYFNGCDSSPILPERGICAHRGANDSHPENTLAAFREAIRLGAHMIEFDVRLSTDGELIIMHDATVDRTTDGTGKVTDLTFVELKSLDAGSWKGRQFKGEKIPTLTETLRIMPKNVWLNVHLKGGAELGKKTAEVIVMEGRLQQTFLACKADAAKAAQEVDSRILICNMERQDSSELYVNETITMKAIFIQLLKGRLDNKLGEYTHKLKANGVNINYYGTNSADELKKLFAAGVDFPLVDEVSKMIKAAADMGIPPLKPKF